jgi:hypothetical protein
MSDSETFLEIRDDQVPDDVWFRNILGILEMTRAQMMSDSETFWEY